MTREPDLPGLDSIEEPLRRLLGFGLFVCVVPSRGAGIDALRWSRGLAERCGRPWGPSSSAGSASSGSLVAEGLLGAGLAERQATAERLNVVREHLGVRKVALLAVVLESDLPWFAERAADLWSVRTAVATHRRLAGHHPRARALTLEQEHVVPAELEDVCSAMSLEGLDVAIPEGRRIRRTSLRDLYQEVDGVGPPPVSAGADPTSGPATDLLTRYPVCVLESEAGSGKSTVLKALARRLARQGKHVVLLSLAGLDEGLVGLDDLDRTLDALCDACPWHPVARARPWLLLDGLDELGDEALRVGTLRLADDLVHRRRVEGAVLATRPDVLEPGERKSQTGAVPRVRLQPFDDARMEAYLRSWVSVALAPEERERHLQALLEAVGLTPDLRGQPHRLRLLCRRPLFLAAMGALVWSRGTELRGEYDVLDAFVGALIHRRKGPLAREYEPEDFRTLAAALAWRLHSRGRYASTVADAVDGDLLDRRTLDALRVGTGLLADLPHVAQFTHAALQDVLAAGEALGRIDVRHHESLAGFLWPEGQARLPGVSRLLVERLASVLPLPLRAFLEREVAEGDWARAAELFAQVWGGRPPLRLRELQAKLCDRLHASTRDVEAVRTDPWMAYANSLWLADLGDERLGRVEFVPVGAGWEIARWPTTNRAFAGFVDDGGYHDRRWWTSSGWKWRHTAAKSRRKDAPERWRLRGFDDGSQPVCGLSFYEAEAFVSWWQARRDGRVTLPSRAVWEAAARTAPGGEAARTPVAHAASRAASWGPELPGASLHLRSASGVEDLGGLVREWLASPEAGAHLAAGYAFCDRPIPLADSVREVTGSGRRWYHPYGVRLARRPR